MDGEFKKIVSLDRFTSSYVLLVFTTVMMPSEVRGVAIGSFTKTLPPI